MLHDHAAIWKETRLLTTLETPIKHSKEILNLLDAVLLPQDYCNHSLLKAHDGR